MISTFIIDWPVVIAIGVIFGYGVRGFPAKGPLRTRAFWSGCGMIFVFVGLVYYSYLLAPDWMWMYFSRGDEIPSWMVFYVLSLYFFAYAAGFFLKGGLAGVHRLLPYLLLAVLVLSEAAVILLLKERYLNVGTMEEYLLRTTVPLAESAVGRVPGTLSLILLPVGVILILWSRRERS